MPWQRLVADVALEINPATNSLAYREVWFTVSRQSGKTSLSLPWRLHRVLSPAFPGPQRVVYTAQHGSEAFKKMMEDELPVIQTSVLGELLTPAHGGRVRLDNRTSGWKLGDGSMIDVMSSTETAGHGRTVDLGVIDEAFAAQDDRLEQAILPATMTRESAQIVGYSTMGTATSIFLNRKVATGREAVAADAGTGVAYFEWAIPMDADIDDPEVWWRHLPALGWTISEDTIRHHRQTMSEAEFRRAVCNQLTVQHERAIPEELWSACRDPHASPAEDAVLALDLDEDGSWSIAAGRDYIAEVVAHGTGDPLDWLTQRDRRRRKVLVDRSGPAGSLISALEGARIDVVKLSRGDVADRCLAFSSAMGDRRLKIRQVGGDLDEALDRAARAASRRSMGDRWVWARGGGDVSALIAVTLAATEVAQAKREPRVRVIG